MPDVSGLVALIASETRWAGLVLEDGTEEQTPGYERIPVRMEITDTSEGMVTIANSEPLRFGPYLAPGQQAIAGVLLASGPESAPLYVVETLRMRRPDDGHMPIFNADEVSMKIRYPA